MLYPLSYGGSDACSARDTPLCPKETRSSAVPLVAVSAGTCEAACTSERAAGSGAGGPPETGTIHTRIVGCVTWLVPLGTRRAGVRPHHRPTVEARSVKDSPSPAAEVRDEPFAHGLFS